MKIAVFSDFHLSAADGSCAFSPKLDPFLELMDAVEATHDLIVLAGDVFDLNVGSRFLDRTGALMETRRDWSRLVERLEREHVLQVFGNHDRFLVREDVPEVLSIEAAGAHLMVMHGHQFMLESRWLEFLKGAVKWAASWDKRRGPGVAAATLYGINTFINHPLPPEVKRSSVTRGAHRLLQKRDDVDMLICGHDHRPRVDETPWGIYANSGACSFGRTDWLSVDLERLSVEVNSLSGG